VSDAAPYVSSFVLEYAYKRSLGPVLSEFFTSLRDGVLKGARTADGRVLMPPTEYDPMSGAAIAGLEVVAETGTIVSWTWVEQPDPRHPVDQPFAFVLVRLDGTDTDLLHVVLSDRARVISGARVRLEWKPAAERVGSMTDIAGFRVLPD
jgi:uncharacterized OB-fold protein